MTEITITRERLVIAALVCALIYLLYTVRAGQDDVPVPNEDVAVAARDAIVSFAGEYAAMREAMADALSESKVKTEKEYYEWFQEQQQPAQLRAFEDLGKLEKDSIYDEDGEFDVDYAESFNRAVSEGFLEIE